MFGYTLLMAGVTRIIEVSFIAPKFTPLNESAASGDNSSEHTLTENAPSSWQTVKAFRHLPPLVSRFFLFAQDCPKTYILSSSLLHLGELVSCDIFIFSNKL